MTGTSINIRVDDREVKQSLGELSKRMANLAPVMRNIGEIIVESVQRNFEEHRGPDLKPWEPLNKSYLAWKTGKKGRNAADILILNRILMGSINYKAGKDSVAIGTNVKYAAIHQLGGSTGPHIIRPRNKKALSWPGASHPVKKVNHPGSKIPARPFLGVRDADWPKINDVITYYMTKGL